MANSKPRGFAAMSKEQRSRIAAMGGRASRRGRKVTTDDSRSSSDDNNSNS